MFTFDKYDAEEATRLTALLVQTESTDPGTYEENVARLLEDIMETELQKYRKILRGSSAYSEMSECVEKHKLRNAASLTDQEVLPGRRNLIFELKGKNSKLPQMVFLCHMDTVVVGDGWTGDELAFSGEIKDGRLYGRGAADMKSGLACALTAVMWELRETAVRGELPQHGIKLIFTVDEEDYMRGADKLLEEGAVRAVDWLLDTEPTDGMVQNCHKGRSWFRVDVHGVTAHASMPWEGADAILAISRFISELKLRVDSLPEHPDMGRTTIVFGTIEGGYRPYVVPDYAAVSIDVRTVPPCNTSMLCDMIGEIKDRLESETEGIKISCKVTGDRYGVAPVEDSELLLHLKESIEGCGYDFRTSIFPGYTDTAVIGSVLGNRSCMSYGPGMLKLAHKPDEYVDIADIERVTAVLKTLLRRLVNN